MNLSPVSTMRNKRAAVLPGLAAILLVSLLPSSLHGQSVDYGALEQLFKEPVTASVTGSPQRASDAPSNMEIITAEDIRRSGAKDIPGVLRSVGGVDTLEWGNDDFDVSVRGYDQANSPRLLVLVDGRQVYADDYGYTPWSTVAVELSSIRQIEVIKGPNSALFGFNAVGGVINIITYDPLYDRVNTVSLTRGTQNMVTASAVATRKLGDRVVVRLSAGGSMDDDFLTPVPSAMSFTPRRRQDRGAFNMDSVISLNSTMQLRFEASHAISQLNEINAGYELNNARYHTTSVKGQFTAEGEFGLLQVTAYTNWLSMAEDPGVLNQHIDTENRVTVAEAHDIFKLGANHTFRAAIEYRRNTESTTPTTGANVFYDIFAASGMWNWKIASTLSLTNALRVDHLSLGRDGFIPPGFPFTNSDWNRGFSQPSYSSGLVWQPNERNTARLTISQGTQLPNLVDSGALLLVTPFLNITGTPLLNPTVVTNYEIGWDRATAYPQILFRASAFHQTSSNLTAVTGNVILTPSGPCVLPSNIGSSDANGLEVALGGPLHQHYRWSVNYRPEQITDHFLPFAQAAAAFVDYQHTTPLHLIKANLGWANGRWEIDSYLHYQSSTNGLQPTATAATLTPVAGFVSMDGRAAYNLTDRMTWSVSGQNLTHASQIQTSGPAVERRVLGTMSIYF
jgi:outer membrane receptor for ferrienterochelin and colicins